MPSPPPVTVCLVDRYDGVRTALRERLEALGAARVVAEAAGVTGARAAPGAVLVVGPRLADGVPPDLLDAGRPVVAYTWLPADERDAALGEISGIVHLDLVEGIAAAVRAASRA